MVIKWIKGFIASGIMSLMFALKNVDDELRADPVDLFKTELRQQIRISFEKFDEQYRQYFYEVLKKADKFLRTANPAKIQRTAGKYGLNYGMKDQSGRRFEHYGFFDEKHKYSGKSLKEVRNLEVDERKLDDDNFPVIVMYQNKKEFSFNESAGIIIGNDTGKGFYAPEIHELARMKKYPLTIVRGEGEILNRIEQLTEFLHVKQVDSTHKILEFFIPMKFGLSNIPDDSKIFKELTNIKQVWFKDEYGDRNSYAINSYYKRGEYKKQTPTGEINPSGFDIIKFKATDIIQLN